jgi:phosphoglucomutase
LAGHGVDVFYRVPAVSRRRRRSPHAILVYNRDRFNGFADGIVSRCTIRRKIWIWHPPHGGPADVDVTKVVQTARPS